MQCNKCFWSNGNCYFLEAKKVKPDCSYFVTLKQMEESMKEGGENYEDRRLSQRTATGNS